MAQEMQAEPKRHLLGRVGGVVLVVAGVLVLSSVSFPRPDDPSDYAEFLALLVENAARTRVVLVAVPVGIWVFAAGIVAIQRSIGDGRASGWARLGTYGVLVGAAAITVQFGLAAGALAEGANGAEDTGVILLAAAAYVRAFAMMVFWLGLGLTGISMLTSGVYPRWSGVPALALGLSMVILSGLSITTGMTLLTTAISGALAALTALWALVLGIASVITNQGRQRSTRPARNHQRTDPRTRPPLT